GAEADATSAFVPGPLPVVGAPEADAPWGSGVFHWGAVPSAAGPAQARWVPSAPEGVTGALEWAGQDAPFAGDGARDAQPELFDLDLHNLLGLLAQDDAGHIGLPPAPNAPWEAAFEPAEPGEPGVLPAPSAPPDPVPGPSRSPHPALHPVLPPGWLEDLRHALTSSTPGLTLRLTHAL